MSSPSEAPRTTVHYRPGVLHSLGRITFDWVKRCFGITHAHNTAERSLRCAEEAVELMQATGVPQETAELLVRTVYGRPVGQPRREMSQLLLTAVTLCEAQRWDPEALLEEELRRVLNKPVAEMAERHAEKNKMGLTVP